MAQLSAADPSGAGAVIRLLRRHWLLLVVPVLLVAIVSYVASKAQTKIYEARGSVFFSVTVSENSGSVDPARAARTQASLALSGVVIDRAAEELGVTPAELSKQVDVVPSKESNELTFSARDPDPNRAVAAVKAIEDAYDQTLTSTKNGDTSTTVQAIVGLRDSLQAQLQRISSQIANGTGDLSALRRQRDDLISQIDALASREADAVVSSALSGSQIVYKPTDAAQVAPRPTRTATLGALLGLAAGVAIVTWRASLDRAGSSTRYAEAVLDTPVIGHIRSDKGRGRRLRSRGRSESLSELALSIALALPEKARVLSLVTAGRDGPSPLLAARLVAALSSGGRSVLLVDAELPEAKLSRAWLSRPLAGLVDAAARSVPVAECITIAAVIESRVQFAFLPAGRVRPELAASLHRTSIADLLADLRLRADVLLVVEGAVHRQPGRMIAETADAVLLAWNGGDREALQDTAARLVEARFRVAGVLIDNAESGDESQLVRVIPDRRALGRNGVASLSRESAVGLNVSEDACSVPLVKGGEEQSSDAVSDLRK